MQGIIDISQLQVPPAKHELATARYFADKGKNVVEWEVKSPQGKAKRTIELNFRKAIKQSQNIIFDLRRINIPEDRCLSELEAEFNQKHAKRLLVIKKNGELIEYPQK